MTRPYISVLVDTYNHERFIEDALVSVLEQDVAEAECEVIVVDDGSTDRTAEIVGKFAPRVRLIRKENGGQASAFNAGIPECAGEIVAFLDGDDWWAPGKLKAVAEALASDEKIGLVGHGVTEVFADGRQHTELLRERPRFRIDSREGARGIPAAQEFSRHEPDDVSRRDFASNRARARGAAVSGGRVSLHTGGAACGCFDLARVADVLPPA